VVSKMGLFDESCPHCDGGIRRPIGGDWWDCNKCGSYDEGDVYGFAADILIKLIKERE